MDELKRILKSEYGIDSSLIVPAVGGFSAKAAYHIKDINGIEYFIKIYDKTLPTTRFFVERIDNYMPALNLLAATPALRGRIITPILTQNGAYKAEIDIDVYVLFLYVSGEVPGIKGMTRAQTLELAETLALLHDTVVPLEKHGLEEDISLPFCGLLAQFLDNMNVKYDDLYKIISPNVELLRFAIKKALHLRDTVRLGCSSIVLCHGDAHGNNVIQGERLVLTDWEDLRLAPPEADLFIYAWHTHGEALLEAYSAARSGYCINRDLLYFYILRRRIEDVWVDIQRLTEESPDEAETVTLLDCINKGIECIRVII